MRIDIFAREMSRWLRGVTVQTASKSRNNPGYSALLNSVLTSRTRQAFAWVDGDFTASDPPTPHVSDAWSGFDSQSETASDELNRGLPADSIVADKQHDIQKEFSWFDVFIEIGVEDGQTSANDWASEASLPLFTPNAARNPFDFDAVLPSKEDAVRRKASWLVELLDFVNRKERAALILKFSELFAAYPHQSTFQTLAGLALQGYSADEIWTSYELKEIWSNTPAWWGSQARGRTRFWTRSLSWTCAARISARRKGLPSEQVIEPDWFAEWNNLPTYDPLSLSFLAFVEARASAFDDGCLDIPSEIERRELVPQPNEYDDFGVVNNRSRTGNLVRGETDGWSLTEKGKKHGDILTPKETGE